MQSVYILIPLSIILAFVIGYFFWWSTHNGQFDDLEGPGHRIIMDDDRPSAYADTHARQQSQDTQEHEAAADNDPGAPS